MNDQEIARRLRLIVAVRTASREVVNTILEVGEDFVTVQSESGGREERRIIYDMIRNAENVTQHGVICRVLAQILGLYAGDY